MCVSVLQYVPTMFLYVHVCMHLCVCSCMFACVYVCPSVEQKLNELARSEKICSQ